MIISGVIGAPKISWLESGKPELRLNLTVEQGDGFRLYVPVYCYGKDCERLAETLEAGDRILIDGKLSWRSTVKAGVKESKMVITCYGVDILAPSGVPQLARSETAATGEPSPGEIVAHDGAQVPSMFDTPAPKGRKPRYPKWKPSVN